MTLVATLYGTAASDNERTEHFVNNFYLGAYARNATSTELQTQRDALNVAAAQGLTQVKSQAETFGRSLFVTQVNDAGISNTQFVINLYEAFFQRGPDAGGLGFWSGSATVGSGRQNVLNAFATCIPFYELAGTLYREAFWLVPDHLGTPRMIVNKSGSLTSVKRHDYLPFGEELYAGNRPTTPGYTGDSVRQHFTGYEADLETGLNFAQARYLSPIQGRFTSVDPLGASVNPASPQSFNRYSYVTNSPLTLTDPSGLFGISPGGSSQGAVTSLGNYTAEGWSTPGPQPPRQPSSTNSLAQVNELAEFFGVPIFIPIYGGHASPGEPQNSGGQQLSACLRDALRPFFPSQTVKGTTYSPIDDARFKAGIPTWVQAGVAVTPGAVDPAAITLGLFDIHYDSGAVNVTGGHVNSLETIVEEVSHTEQFLQVWAGLPDAIGGKYNMHVPNYADAQVAWKGYYLYSGAKAVSRFHAPYNNEVEGWAQRNKQSIMNSLRQHDTANQGLLCGFDLYPRSR